MWDFPGGPVVKNPPASAGDTGLIPGLGTKILHAAEQLNPYTATTEPPCYGGAHGLQQKIPHNAMLIPRAVEEPTGYNIRSHIMQCRSHVLQLKPDAAK